MISNSSLPIYLETPSIQPFKLYTQIMQKLYKFWTEQRNQNVKTDKNVATTHQEWHVLDGKLKQYWEIHQTSA